MFSFKKLKIKYRLLLFVLVALSGLFFSMLVSATSLRTTLDNEKQLKTRHVVETAYGVVAHFYREASEGRISEQEAKKSAIAALRSLRYESSDYFWINDMRPFMIMHPYKTELDGTDLSEYKDPEGNRLFVEFVDVVRKQNAGFVHYLWPKPGVDKPVRKISYVKGFAPWGWVVGAGFTWTTWTPLSGEKFARISCSWR